MKRYMKMKKYLKYALLLVAAATVVYMVYTYVSFNQKGLDTWLAGQTEENHYPNWEKEIWLLKADRNILNKSHLLISKAYLMKGASDSYQLRFRIAYCIPSLHGSLFEDTDWVKLADSNGNDYASCLTVYSSGIAGLNCINATLTMDADTFSALSGDKLTVSVVCTEDDSLHNKSSYANCEAEILIPAEAN